MSTRRVYSIDTCTLVDFGRNYKKDYFPFIWETLDDLISREQLVASEFVLEEIRRLNDELAEWAKTRKALFKKTNIEQIAIVKEIMESHGGLVDHNKEVNSADPFVIALAIEGNNEQASELFPAGVFVVLTEESFRPGRIRIPNVCGYYGLECINKFGFFSEMGWRNFVPAV